MLAWLAHFIGCCPSKKVNHSFCVDQTLLTHLEEMQTAIETEEFNRHISALIKQELQILETINRIERSESTPKEDLGEGRRMSLLESDNNPLPINQWHILPRDNPLITLIKLGLTVPLLKQMPFALFDQLMSFSKQVDIISQRKKTFSTNPSLSWIMKTANLSHPQDCAFISVEDFQQALFEPKISSYRP
ncbi:MAG: hypothetical protein H2069_04995 [Legionella sp.]|nr:hypothetical protein [Legionella sp.]